MSTKEKVPPPPRDSAKSGLSWDAAAEEAAGVAEDKGWEGEYATQIAHDRLRHLKHIGLVVSAFIWLFAAIFILCLSIWVFHQVSPAYWHWLSPGQLSSIQSVIFSGALGAVFTSGIRNFVLPEKPK